MFERVRDAVRRLVQFGKKDRQDKLDRPSRRRLELSGDPDHIYAVGDVHGCIEKLRDIELRITADAESRTGTKLLVYLGDYIDRGPDSAAVLDHLMSPAPEGFRRVCLCGNHEAILVELVDKGGLPDDWVRLGGDRTLLSYGYDVHYMSENIGSTPGDAFDALPIEHLAFLRSLPLSLATPRYFFAHAGARPGVDMAAQTEDDLLWIRDEFLLAPNPAFGRCVVHGHTPTTEPVALDWRIGVDTGAYMGGPLTAVHLSAEGVRFLASP